MQNQPLLLSSLLQHADRFHGNTEIVSRTVEGPIHRYTYQDAARRARKGGAADGLGALEQPSNFFVDNAGEGSRGS